MYGSTVKGTLQEDSDVDGTWFRTVGTTDTVNTTIEVSPIDAVLIRTRFDLNTQNNLELKVRTLMAERIHIPAEELPHLRVLPISESIIDEQIQHALPWAKAMQAYKERHNLINKYLDENSGLDWRDAPEHIPPPDLASVGSNIAAMFHLQIGKGIEPYRKYVIDQLMSQGDLGEIIWNDIIVSVENIEQNLNSGSLTKGYPRTLLEAKAVYVPSSLYGGEIQRK